MPPTSPDSILGVPLCFLKTRPPHYAAQFNSRHTGYWASLGTPNPVTFSAKQRAPLAHIPEAPRTCQRHHPSRSSFSRPASGLPPSPLPHPRRKWLLCEQDREVSEHGTPVYPHLEMSCGFKAAPAPGILSSVRKRSCGFLARLPRCSPAPGPRPISRPTNCTICSLFYQLGFLSFFLSFFKESHSFFSLQNILKVFIYLFLAALGLGCCTGFL